jgi:anti-sigma B factor antagonist
MLSGDVTDQTGLNERPVATIEQRGDATVVHLAGELDLYNAPQVRAALLEACAGDPERLVVDLAEVGFVDSTVLGVLIEARTKLPNRRSFLLAAAGHDTHRALQISGLERHLSVHKTVAEALSAPLEQPKPH